MLKYAKIINEETKQVSVGLGENTDFYESIGMVEMDVEEAYNGRWYVKGYAPEKPAPTWEEVDRMRVQYRREHIDDKTTARSRKLANKTWTDEDEQAFLALDAEVTAYIEEHFPYPKES